MRKKIITAGLCVLVAGFALAPTVNAATIETVPTQEISAFWRKKDKQEEVPEQTAPEQKQEEVPASPEPEQIPKQDKKDQAPSTDASFVYNPYGVNPQQNTAPATIQGGSGAPQTNPATPQTTPQTNQHTPQNHQQGGTRIYQGTEYMPGISEQIERILDSQPAIQLDPNAYIIQHEDALWLVMGNIRAKLEILIYVDGKNVDAQFPAGYDRGNTLPIFK